jgi:Plant mobile domain
VCTAITSCRCFGITLTHLGSVPSASGGATPPTPSSLMIKSFLSLSDSEFLISLIGPECYASTRDPFDTGRPDLYCDVPAFPHDTLCSHDISQETYLTTFLSWWICFFLLPSSGARTIRPSVFVMASQVARGERVSLAMPVLANIYRSLRSLTSSRDPSRYRELMPWHFISGWLHMHWSDVYHSSLSSDLRTSLPFLSDLAGTESASLTPEDARFRFYRSRDHLRSNWPLIAWMGVLTDL